MLRNVAVDRLIHIYSPDRQCDLYGDVVRPRTARFARLTYAPKNIHDPIFEEETARGGSFCRGAEHCGDPIAGYVTVMVLYPWIEPVLDSMVIRSVGKPTNLRA